MQKHKTCSICNIKKEITFFYKKGAQCKLCLQNKQNEYCKNNKIECKKRSKQYRQKNKEKLKKIRKQYYKENKDKVLIQQKGYREQHKEDICKQNKIYREKNKEILSEKIKKYYKANFKQIKENKKQYQKKNSERLNEYSRAYQKNKRANDILFKLRRDFSRAVWAALRKQLSSKNGKSMLKFLPYNMESLKNHIELLFSHPDNLTIGGNVWMTWDNWGLYRCENWNNNDSSTWVWNIDHIIPHSLFDYKSMEDDKFKKCWALENLRPLRADINITEGSNRIRHSGVII